MGALHCHFETTLKYFWMLKMLSTHWTMTLHEEDPSYLALGTDSHTFHKKVRHSELQSSRAGISTYSRQGHTLCHCCLCAMWKRNY